MYRARAFARRRTSRFLVRAIHPPYDGPSTADNGNLIGWTCRACSAAAYIGYRYAGDPNAYCGHCGNALGEIERLAESVLALVAAFQADAKQHHDANPGSPDGFVGVDEAARLLNTTEKAIYNMVARGEIPHFRLGRRLRFSRPGLVRFIEQRRAPSPERNRR